MNTLGALVFCSLLDREAYERRGRASSRDLVGLFCVARLLLVCAVQPCYQIPFEKTVTMIKSTTMAMTMTTTITMPMTTTMTLTITITYYYD